jgi:D-inositol-3-phosphate glycosyltransferase
MHPPVTRERLADWYRAADLVAVPSYSESFGLVAIEAQATGTPVVAANVGGLATAVADGVSGVLVDGHDPADWAATIGSLLADPSRLRSLSHAAARHALRFGWDATVDATLAVYTAARRERLARLVAANGNGSDGDAGSAAAPVPAGTVDVAP